MEAPKSRGMQLLRAPPCIMRCMDEVRVCTCRSTLGTRRCPSPSSHPRWVPPERTDEELPPVFLPEPGTPCHPSQWRSLLGCPCHYSSTGEAFSSAFPQNKIQPLAMLFQRISESLTSFSAEPRAAVCLVIPLRAMPLSLGVCMLRTSFPICAAAISCRADKGADRYPSCKTQREWKFSVPPRNRQTLQSICNLLGEVLLTRAALQAP